MKKNRYFLSLIIMFTTILELSTLAQEESSIAQIFESIYHDTSPPLRDIPESPITQSKWRDGIIPLNKVDPQFEDRYMNDPDLQKFMGVEGISEIITSWNGISADGYAPPDPSGDVGPNHYMLATNVRFQIWNKTGTSVLGPLNLGTIWSGFPGPWASSLNDGDPIVLFDEAAGRWFIAQFSLPNYPSSPSYILVAISQTGNPTGSWHRYGFEFNTAIPDYPKFGVWPDGYYMSANSFNPSYVGTIAAAFERSQMLNGNAAQMVMFTRSSSTTWSLLPSDWNGTNTPPTGAPNYFGQIHDNARYGGSDGFDIFSFSVNWTTPGNSTFTGPSFLTTSPFSTVDGIPQLGTSTLLDDLSVMTMNRLDYRNFGTHQSMVVCHTVDAGSDRAGVRWYEFRRTSSSWSIYQQGTYAPADGLHRWMGSIAINSNGDIALGYSVSGTSIYPGIRYTGRLAGDTPGVMTITEETIQAGLGAQTGLYRWGDYTQMVVDPDGQTFWYVNQYQPSTGSYNWRTRIASMSFGPPCPVTPALNPNPANGATSVSINVPNLSWTNGSGATLCEVWFGEIGSMVKVYDGILITSWPILGPLSYSTTHSWQIVGKNGTCSVSGPLWTFTTEQNPNLIIETINVYPQNSNYWTGTCNSSSKTQVSFVDADGSSYAGWMAFDISAIPDDATITSIVFNGYLYANNHPYWAITPMGTINPVTGSASAIYTQVSNNYQQGTAYSYNEESGTLSNGWKNRTLGTTAPSDLQNKLAQDWFAIGVYEWETGTTYYVNFHGWAQANPPYLEVTYEYINVAVEDPTNVSATPVSSSQIDVGFTPNASNNNVVFVWNTTGTFTTPTGTPPGVGQSFAGGTLLFNGTTSPVNHEGLNPLTTYHYKLFSYDGINYSSGVVVNETTFAPGAAFDFAIQVRDNAGLSSYINFGLDLTATDGIDVALGEAELPGFPPGGYAAAWLFPDFTTLSYYDYRAPGDPPAFPFTGHKSHIIRIQTDIPAGNPMTISWNLPSTIATTSTIGVPGNEVSFSGTGSHSWNYNPVSLQYIFVEVDYIDTVNTFELNVSVQNGWNMVSAPGINPTGMLVGDWWPHLTGSVFGFNGVQYVATTDATPGEGYWMKNTEAEIYSYEAIQIVAHDQIPVTLGWNMIGGYETSPTIAALVAANPQITGNVFGFNGVQYVAATNLVPGYGYWVKVTSAGTITIPDAFSQGSEEVVERFKDDWGRIVLTDALGISRTLYAVKGEVDLDQYELPPLPPAGIFDIRYSSGRMAEDINSAIQTIDMVGITYPITVRVEGMDIRLQDMTGKALNQNLKSGEEIVIGDAAIQKLMVSAELVPTVYALEQNYPNPFNPATTIKFSLPEAGYVTLSIYNTLGQKVAELVNTNLEAGYYNYQWNASNIASGMYIYELRTDKFVSVKKMLLLK